eukprot:TRINITY_DN5311_c0_g1_i2.p4 TRINITY_DN5311_c0_g1~~TRINITY_DN5311_c0_g1_i2.p4  ORF type:complete len:108 (+),score=5.34 TRINITY_DN5311_c0_g1_i2:931-1254(+)
MFSFVYTWYIQYEHNIQSETTTCCVTFSNAEKLLTPGVKSVAFVELYIRFNVQLKSLIFESKTLLTIHIEGTRVFTAYQKKKKKKKDRKSTRLNSSPEIPARLPSSA